MIEVNETLYWCIDNAIRAFEIQNIRNLIGHQCAFGFVGLTKFLLNKCF